MVFSLDKLDNTDNLEDGSLSNTPLTHHMTVSDEFTHLESVTPQYKQLRKGEFASITLQIMDQKDNSITGGPEMTIVLHIR